MQQDSGTVIQLRAQLRDSQAADKQREAEPRARHRQNNASVKEEEEQEARIKEEEAEEEDHLEDPHLAGRFMNLVRPPPEEPHPLTLSATYAL